jgi:N-acetylglucosamine-6-phosphate deacetylase
MKQFLLRGGDLITPLEQRAADLFVTDGKLSLPGSVNSKSSACEVIDVSNCYVTPGLIDLQVNGGGTCNLWADPNAEQFSDLCRNLIEHGVTTFLPTLITDEVEHLLKNILFLESMGAGSLLPESKNLIDIAGIHLEGPFLSPERTGVHPPRFVIPFDVETLKRLIKPSVKLVTLAPEKEGADRALSFLKEKQVSVSLGHSNATFEEANLAFERGVRLVTHLFNALPAFHHRQPGAVGAALLNQSVSCCIICDGLHLNPNTVRLVVKVKGVDRLILVTDIAFVGTKSGSLVGSSIYLCEAVRNIVNWGAASFREAVQMATLNAAQAIKIDNRAGKIADGYPANIVIWDKQTLAIRSVYFQGQMVFSSVGVPA